VSIHDLPPFALRRNGGQIAGTLSGKFLEKRLIRRVKSTIVTRTVVVEDVDRMTV